MPTRKAEAEWTGSLKDGAGRVKLGSGAFEGSYSFASRFENGKGTNPEELLGAAHAGCFTMALSFTLNNAGFVATAIETEAQLTMDPVDGKPTITGIHLVTRAQVPKIAAAQFAEIASNAKVNCVISRALSPSITVTLDAALTP